MQGVKNPFIIGAYVAPEYFCDRVQETSLLRKHMDNGRNVALTAPRRMGKTGLIHHLFHDENIQKEYYTFFIDLYATGSMAEMVQLLATAICQQLQSGVEKWWEKFSTVVKSLSVGLSVDPKDGQPSFSIGLGQISSPEHSLNEIFQYLESADRPCIVAIDEFQQIANYAEKNVEALLRTMIQCCKNTHFIFSGSKRHMMTQMFLSPSRPFYQNAINMSLMPLDKVVYTEFCQMQFEKNGKYLDASVVDAVYTEYEGYTWYMHMLMNELYADTPTGEMCTVDMIDEALQTIVLSQEQTYKDQLALIPIKQKMVLQAVAKEVRVSGITSSAFLRKYALPSSSSVQAALKGLLEKEIITQAEGVYFVYDFFFAKWLRLQQ